MIPDNITPGTGTHDSLKDAFNTMAEETDKKNATPPENNGDEQTGTEENNTEGPAMDDDYIESVTDTAFAILDSTQCTVFKIMANRKRKKRAIQIDADNGVSRLMQLRAEKEANKNDKVDIINNYTGTDAKLLQMDAVVDDFINNLGFTEKQIAMMRPGLRMMVKKNAGKIPPELLFYAGLATAIGGNIAEYYQL